MAKKEMFRYNVAEHSRKDVMFTIKEDGLIFYGIARCNLKIGDKFNKELGKTIAIGRALEAKRLFDEGTPINFDDGDVKADRLGVVSEDYVTALLDYFDGLSCSR